MRSVAFIALLVVEALAFGQGFNKRYDMLGLSNDQVGWGIEDSDSCFTVVSFSYDTDSLGPDSFFTHASVLLSRLTGAGVLISESRTYRPGHGTFPGWANCCDTIPGGGYVVGGSSEDTTGFDEIYLMRFNAQGDTLWTRVFGVPDQNWVGYQVKRTADGGFIIVGAYDPDNNVSGFALKTDSSGTEQWRETYGGSQTDYFVSIHEVFPGHYYMGGRKRLTQQNGQLWVQRVDNVGTGVWAKLWGSGFDEPNAHVIATADGHALVASAWGYSNTPGSLRPYMAKLDSSDGSIIWEHQYGPATFSTTLFAVKERADESLIACGVCYYGGEQQGLLLRTTSEGDSIWMRSYFYQDSLMNDGTGRFYDVLPTDDGGFIAAGATYFSASGNNPPGISQDTWVVKVDSMGCIVPGCDATGVTEVITNLADGLSLWPVPLSPSRGEAVLKVSIHLPSNFTTEGPLMLTVTSLDGKLVKQQRVATSSVTEEVDVSGLAAGGYSLHLSDGQRWIAGKKFVVQ